MRFFVLIYGDLVLWERNKPLLTVLKHHDIVMDGRSLYYEMFGPFYCSFHVGPAYFIVVLDNANQESIDPWQMIWLKEELEKSKRFKYRFVFIHVPLFSPTTRKTEHIMSDTQNAKELNKLFDD